METKRKVLILSEAVEASNDLSIKSAESRCFHASSCVCGRLEIEAQEQALEQLEKSSQEATRRAHDAEQKAKSALDTLKVCLSPPSHTISLRDWWNFICSLSS